MAFGTKNKGRSDTDNYFRNLAEQDRGSADTALNTAAQPDALEARQRDHALALDKWSRGESGPIDVRNMPDGGVNMGLFNDATQVHDAGRVGRGVGSMSGTANPNFVASLNKENEMERHKMASGLLEQNVQGELAANNAQMTDLSQMANARNMNVAGMRENRYGQERGNELRYLLRPKQPNFFKQLAQQWLSPSTFAAGGAMGG